MRMRKEALNRKKLFAGTRRREIREISDRALAFITIGVLKSVCAVQDFLMIHLSPFRILLLCLSALPYLMYSSAAWAGEENSKPAATAPALDARNLLEWGKKGSGPGEFNVPISIAVSPSEEVFVVDHYNARVQRFAKDGKFIGEFSGGPSPSGIAIDKDGNVYVGHFGDIPKGSKDNQRTPANIIVFDPSGKFLRQWGRTGDGDGEFNMPGGMAFDRDGLLYVADQTNHRIQVFDPTGKFIRKWGEYGSKPGQFGGNEPIKSRVGGPQFVTFDREGNVYTTEAELGRIQKFTPMGKFLMSWGDNQDKPGSFGGKLAGDVPHSGGLKGPIALCFDKENRLWISAVCGRVQAFSTQGQYLGGFGFEQGSKSGQFWAPHGVAVDREGHLYVVDALNHRIQKFAISK